MQALIALILANLPTIISAGEAGYKFIASVRDAAKQSGEWTDAHEADFQQNLSAMAMDPAWQMDLPAPNQAPVTDQAEIVESQAAPAPAPDQAPVTDQAEIVESQAAPAPAPEVAEVALGSAVVCPTCGKTLIPDHPENCNCVNA